MLLGQSLVQSGIVSIEDVQMALQMQVVHGGRLGTSLLRKGLVDIDTLSAALGRHTGIPAARLKHFEQVEQDVLQAVPGALAAKHRALPLAWAGRKELLVAFRDPKDMLAIDEIAFAVGARIRPFIGPELCVLRYIERYYGIRVELEFTAGSAQDRGQRGDRRKPPDPTPPRGPSVREPPRQGALRAQPQPRNASGVPGRWGSGAALPAGGPPPPENPSTAAARPRPNLLPHPSAWSGEPMPMAAGPLPEVPGLPGSGTIGGPGGGQAGGQIGVPGPLPQIGTPVSSLLGSPPPTGTPLGSALAAAPSSLPGQASGPVGTPLVAAFGPNLSPPLGQGVGTLSIGTGSPLGTPLVPGGPGGLPPALPGGAPATLGGPGLIPTSLPGQHVPPVGTPLVPGLVQGGGPPSGAPLVPGMAPSAGAPLMQALAASPGGPLGTLQGAPLAGGVNPGAGPPGALSGGPIAGAPHHAATIQGGPLTGAPHHAATIQGGPLTGAPHHAATIQGGPLNGAPLHAGTVQGGALPGAPVPGAPLHAGTVQGGTIAGAPLHAGTVQGAPFAGGPFPGAPLQAGANQGGPLAGSPFPGAPPHTGTPPGAPLTGTPVHGGTIQGAPLTGTPVHGGTIQGAPLTGTPVHAGTIQGAPLTGVLAGPGPFPGPGTPLHRAASVPLGPGGSPGALDPFFNYATAAVHPWPEGQFGGTGGEPGAHQAAADTGAVPLAPAVDFVEWTSEPSRWELPEPKRPDDGLSFMAEANRAPQLGWPLAPHPGDPGLGVPGALGGVPFPEPPVRAGNIVPITQVPGSGPGMGEPILGRKLEETARGPLLPTGDAGVASSSATMPGAASTAGAARIPGAAGFADSAGPAATPGAAGVSSAAGAAPIPGGAGAPERAEEVLELRSEDIEEPGRRGTKPSGSATPAAADPGPVATAHAGGSATPAAADPGPVATAHEPAQHERGGAAAQSAATEPSAGVTARSEGTAAPDARVTAPSPGTATEGTGAPAPSTGEQKKSAPAPSTGDQRASTPAPSTGDQVASAPAPSTGDQVASAPAPSTEDGTESIGGQSAGPAPTIDTDPRIAAESAGATTGVAAPQGVAVAAPAQSPTTAGHDATQADEAHAPVGAAESARGAELAARNTEDAADVGWAAEAASERPAAHVRSTGEPLAGQAPQLVGSAAGTPAGARSVGEPQRAGGKDVRTGGSAAARVDELEAVPGDPPAAAGTPAPESPGEAITDPREASARAAASAPRPQSAATSEESAAPTTASPADSTRGQSRPPGQVESETTEIALADWGAAIAPSGDMAPAPVSTGTGGATSGATSLEDRKDERASSAETSATSANAARAAARPGEHEPRGEPSPDPDDEIIEIVEVPAPGLRIPRMEASGPDTADAAIDSISIEEEPPEVEHEDADASSACRERPTPEWIEGPGPSSEDVGEFAITEDVPARAGSAAPGSLEDEDPTGEILIVPVSDEPLPEAARARAGGATLEHGAEAQDSSQRPVAVLPTLSEIPDVVTERTALASEVAAPPPPDPAEAAAPPPTDPAEAAAHPLRGAPAPGSEAEPGARADVGEHSSTSASRETESSQSTGPAPGSAREASFPDPAEPTRSGEPTRGSTREAASPDLVLSTVSTSAPQAPHLTAVVPARAEDDQQAAMAARPASETAAPSGPQIQEEDSRRSGTAVISGQAGDLQGPSDTAPTPPATPPPDPRASEPNPTRDEEPSGEVPSSGSGETARSVAAGQTGRHGSGREERAGRGPRALRDPRPWSHTSRESPARGPDLAAQTAPPEAGGDVAPIEAARPDTVGQEPNTGRLTAKQVRPPTNYARFQRAARAFGPCSDPYPNSIGQEPDPGDGGHRNAPALARGPDLDRAERPAAAPSAPADLDHAEGPKGAPSAADVVVPPAPGSTPADAPSPSRAAGEHPRGPQETRTAPLESTASSQAGGVSAPETAPERAAQPGADAAQSGAEQGSGQVAATSAEARQRRPRSPSTRGTRSGTTPDTSTSTSAQVPEEVRAEATPASTLGGAVLTTASKPPASTPASTSTSTSAQVPEEVRAEATPASTLGGAVLTTAPKPPAPDAWLISVSAAASAAYTGAMATHTATPGALAAVTGAGLGQLLAPPTDEGSMAPKDSAQPGAQTRRGAAGSGNPSADGAPTALRLLGSSMTPANPARAPIGQIGPPADAPELHTGNIHSWGATEDLSGLLVHASPGSLLSFDDALAAVQAAEDRDTIREAIVDYMRGKFGVGLIFVVKDGIAFGWTGFGPELNPRLIGSVALSLDAPSVLAFAYQRVAVFRGSPSETAGVMQSHFYKLIKSATPSEALAAPIVVRERVVNLVYAHVANGSWVPTQAASEMGRLCRAAAEGFVRVIKRQKLERT